MESVRKTDPARARECYLCLRIDASEYYGELRELGFETSQARKVLSFLEETYLAFPPVLCGRTAKGIKAGFAYVFSLVFGACTYGHCYPLFSQDKIADHWKLGKRCGVSHARAINLPRGYITHSGTPTVRHVYKAILEMWAKKLDFTGTTEVLGWLRKRFT